MALRRDMRHPDLSPLASFGERRSVPVDKAPVVSGRLQQAGNANALGVLALTFPGPKVGYHWEIVRVGVTGAGIAKAYVGGVSDGGWAPMFSPSAENDVEESVAAIHVPGGVQFIINFTEAGAGTLCTAVIQYLSIKY